MFALGICRQQRRVARIYGLSASGGKEAHRGVFGAEAEVVKRRRKKAIYDTAMGVFNGGQCSSAQLATRSSRHLKYTACDKELHTFSAASRLSHRNIVNRKAVPPFQVAK
jgi:hypothetical protein